MLISVSKIKHLRYNNEDFTTLLVKLLRFKSPCIKVSKKQNVAQVTFST